MEGSFAKVGTFSYYVVFLGAFAGSKDNLGFSFSEMKLKT